MTDEPWPALPYEAWKDTCATLHMWTQVVGKAWAIAMQVTSRSVHADAAACPAHVHHRVSTSSTTR